MKGWERLVRCYVSPAKRNKIQDWYESLLSGEQADMDAFIGIMRKLREWAMPDYRPRLKGINESLGELRWQSHGKQYRLIGYFEGEVYIALLGCTHKQQRYDPSSAIETAIDRKKKIRNGEATLCDYRL